MNMKHLNGKKNHKFPAQGTGKLYSNCLDNKNFSREILNQ